MTILLAHAVLAAALCSGLAGQTPGGGPGRQPGPGTLKPEPVTFTPARVFDDLREAAQASPIAERLTVTVKGEQSPVSANIVLRIAPGRERDQRDSRVSIEGGSLRVYATGGTKDAPGELIAVSTTNSAVYYRLPLEGAPTLAALSEALLPLPLPTLAVYFAPGGAAVADPTPLTRNITWEPTTVQVAEPPLPPIVLTGAMKGQPGQPATLHLEYQQGRLRLRSFSAPLAVSGASPRTLTVTAAWIEPGDPQSWVIDVAGRTRVNTLAGLGLKPESPAAVEPAKTPEGGQPKSEPPPPAAPAPAEPKPSAPPATDPPKPGPKP